jgi:hypothetical protein
MLVDVEIKGTTPILQHRFSDEAEVSVTKGTRNVSIKNELPRDQAERVCYRNRDGYLYQPSTQIFAMLKESGRDHKQKGSRRSLKYIVPSAIRMPDLEIPVLNAKGKKVKDFEVDSRPVTIPSTKGRIMRHRPRIDEWVLRFRLEIDEDVLDADIVHQLLSEGGKRCGIGDFRPQTFGQFGQFYITSWKKVE